MTIPLPQPMERRTGVLRGWDIDHRPWEGVADRHCPTVAKAGANGKGTVGTDPTKVAEGAEGGFRSGFKGSTDLKDPVQTLRR